MNAPLPVHPIDWAQPTNHVSGYPVGTTFDIWRNGKHQIAKLTRTWPTGDTWNIYTAPRYQGAEPSYLYSEGWRYVIEHTL